LQLFHGFFEKKNCFFKIENQLPKNRSKYFFKDFIHV